MMSKYIPQPLTPQQEAKLQLLEANKKAADIHSHWLDSLYDVIDHIQFEIMSKAREECYQKLFIQYYPDLNLEDYPQDMVKELINIRVEDIITISKVAQEIALSKDETLLSLFEYRAEKSKEYQENSVIINRQLGELNYLKDKDDEYKEYEIGQKAIEEYKEENE